MKGCLKWAVILGGLGMCALVAMVVAMGGGTSTGIQTNTGGQTASTKAEEIQVAHIGQTVQSANWLMTVTSRPERAGQIGNQFLSETASGEFLIVPVTVTNKGNETSTISSWQFTLLDSQNRKFETHTSAMTTLASTENAPMVFLEQVSPDLSVKFKLVFDIPSTAENLRLEFRGAMTGQPVYVSLE